MFRIKIDYNSPVAIYQQVIHVIKLEILSGRLKNGDQLPPIRELAKVLKLNPNTVAKAYYTLEQEGYFTSKKGSGNWVNIRKLNLDSLRAGMIEAEFKEFLDNAFSLGADKDLLNKLMARYLNNG